MDERTQITGCDNMAEDCPNCPRWLDDCEGLEEYDVDCAWK